MNSTKLHSTARAFLAALAGLTVAGVILVTAGATPRAYGATTTTTTTTTTTASASARQQASGQRAGDACRFGIEVTVTRTGHASYRVTGPCQPSRAMLRRIGRMIGLPAWLHFPHIGRHDAVVCGGNCASSARVTDSGQAFGS